MATTAIPLEIDAVSEFEIQDPPACLLTKPLLTTIVGGEKFQVTVPREIRTIFDLREGDVLEWDFTDRNELVIRPKRAQLITPQLRRTVAQLRNAQARNRERPSSNPARVPNG